MKTTALILTVLIATVVALGCTQPIVYRDTPPKTVYKEKQCPAGLEFTDRSLMDITWQNAAVMTLCNKNAGSAADMALCFHSQIGSYHNVMFLALTEDDGKRCWKYAINKDGVCRHYEGGQVCNWSKVWDLYEYCRGK